MNNNINNNNADIDSSLAGFYDNVSKAPILSATISKTDYNIPDMPKYEIPVESSPVLTGIDTLGEVITDTSGGTADYGYVPLQLPQNQQATQAQPTIGQQVQQASNQPLAGIDNSVLSKYNYGIGDTPQQIAEKAATNLLNPLRPYENIRTGNHAGDVITNAIPAVYTSIGKGLVQGATGILASVPLLADAAQGALFANSIEQYPEIFQTEEYKKSPISNYAYNRYQTYKALKDQLSLPFIEAAYDTESKLPMPIRGLRASYDILFPSDSNLNRQNLKDYWNAATSGNDKEFMKQQANAVERLGTTGLYDALDIISLGQAAKLKAINVAKTLRGTKGTTSLSKSIADKLNAGKVEEAGDIAQYVSDALANVKFDKVYNKLSEFKNKFSNVNLPKVLQSIEEGTVELTKKELDAKKFLRSTMDEYHNILDGMGLAVDRRVQSIAQGLVRKFGMQYHEAMKILTPIIENPEMYKPFAVRKFNNVFDFYTKTLHDITGVGENKLKNTLRHAIRKAKDGELPKKNTVGLTNFDTGEIIIKDLKDAGTVAHEIAHVLLDNISTAVRENNIKAIDFMNNANMQVFDNIKGFKIGDTVNSAAHEILAYALEAYLNPNFKLPKDLKGLSSGVRIAQNSKLFKSAIKFWDNLFTVQDTKNLNFTDGAIKDLKNSSDPVMRAIPEFNELFNKGDIFPVPHVDAGNYAGVTGDVARRYASVKGGIERVFGLQTYEEMANTLNNVDYLSDNLTRTIGNKIAVDEIIKASNEIDADKLKSGDIGYVSAKDLDNINDVKSLQGKITDVQTGADDIKVSKRMINSMVKNEEFLRNAGNPYKSGNPMGTFYKFNRSMMLASGNYLIGNITSTAFNTLLNSNVRLLSDVADASRTGGNLSRLIGTKRPLKATQIDFDNKILSTADKYTNKPIRDAFNIVDVSQQNFASEVAVNNYLAKKGVPLAQREAYIKNAPIEELYEMISTAQDTAALNTRFSLIPESLRPIVATVDAFYRWKDTATRSTVRTWARNPLTSNLVVNHFLARIGFDQEMQNRMRINADIDKPYVHINYNPATGRYRDESAELSPQVTAVKLAGKVAEAIGTGKYQDLFKSSFESTANLTPVGYGLVNSLFGKDEYGNPLYRAQDADGNPILIDRNTKARYRVLPDGSTEQIGILSDEIIPNVAKQTLAPLKFYNKTVMPAVQVGLDALGVPKFMFNPNATGLTPSFNPNDPNINPNRAIFQEESLRKLMGIYSSSEYDYPTSYSNVDILPSRVKQLMRQRGRQMNKQDFYRYYYGGGEQ